MSVGETLFSSFLGRKSNTRVTRTAREIARTRKEVRDRENAEASLKAAQQERTRLEKQFQSEVANAEARMSFLTETLEKVEIGLTKADITIRLVALVWML